MFGQARLSITYRLKWFSAAALAVLLIASSQPGDVIAITASCDYAPEPGGPAVNSAVVRHLVVKSPCCRPSPLYLTQGWHRIHLYKKEPRFDYYTEHANGMLVRAFASVDGEVRLVDGIQASDGRIMVDGELLERVEPPEP